MLSEKPWRAEAVLQFIASVFASLFLGVGISGVLRKIGVNGFQNPEDFGMALIGMLSLQGATWIFIWIFLRQHQLDLGTAFGWRKPEWKRTIGFAATFAVLMLIAVWTLQIVSGDVLTRLGWPPEQQAVVKLLSGDKPWWVHVYLGLFALVVAPVAEEFIFRGMLFPFLKQLGWPRTAWVGVSALFALIHFNVGTFVPLFALALALTWLYELTDNLLAPITAHALFNAANLIVLYLFQM